MRYEFVGRLLLKRLPVNHPFEKKMYFYLSVLNQYIVGTYWKHIQSWNIVAWTNIMLALKSTARGRIVPGRYLPQYPPPLHEPLLKKKSSQRCTTKWSIIFLIKYVPRFGSVSPGNYSSWNLPNETSLNLAFKSKFSWRSISSIWINNGAHWISYRP